MLRGKTNYPRCCCAGTSVHHPFWLCAFLDTMVNHNNTEGDEGLRHSRQQQQQQHQGSKTPFGGPWSPQSGLPWFKMWMPKPPPGAAESERPPGNAMDSCGFKLIMGTVGGDYFVEFAYFVFWAYLIAHAGWGFVGEPGSTFPDDADGAEFYTRRKSLPNLPCPCVVAEEWSGKENLRCAISQRWRCRITTACR